MPPHRLSVSPASLTALWRLPRYLLIAAALTLTGCATQQAGNQHAERGGSIRDSYLSQTKSDPLGAYLASNEFNSSYARAQYPTSSDFSRFTDTKALANAALDQLGVKYKYGGGAPNTGFDCSGLVIYAAEKSLGLKLPRQSAQIARQGIAVQKKDLKRGDLVFFNTRGHRFSHVGIYLGDRKFVHAPSRGSVVRVESMDIGYWKKRYNGARRLSPDAGNLTAMK